jgi:hypothetical protein
MLFLRSEQARLKRALLWDEMMPEMKPFVKKYQREVNEELARLTGN